MCLHGRRNLFLHHRKVDHRNIDLHRARRAVSAVGALPGIRVVRGVCQNAGVVLLLLRSRLIRSCLPRVLRRIVSRENARDCRSGQRIVDTLHRSQRHSERRRLRRKQPSARVSLHNGDSHALLLADPVQLRSLGINSAQLLRIAVREIGVHVLACRKQVERGVDAEQDHLDLSGKRSQLCHSGIVRAHSDMADHASVLLFLYIGEEFSLHDPVEFLLLIHKVNHAQINIVCLKTCQKIRKRLLHLVQLPGADILAVLPGRTEMSLNNPFLPLSFQRFSDIGADIRL